MILVPNSLLSIAGMVSIWEPAPEPPTRIPSRTASCQVLIGERVPDDADRGGGVDAAEPVHLARIELRALRCHRAAQTARSNGPSRSWCRPAAPRDADRSWRGCRRRPACSARRSLGCREMCALRYGAKAMRIAGIAAAGTGAEDQDDLLAAVEIGDRIARRATARRHKRQAHKRLPRPANARPARCIAAASHASVRHHVDQDAVGIGEPVLAHGAAALEQRVERRAFLAGPTGAGAAADCRRRCARRRP